MLFSDRQNKSTQILKALIALFITLGPLLIQLLTIDASTYILLFIFTIVLSIRIMKKSTVYISTFLVGIAFLILFTLIFTPFTRSGIGQIKYIAQMFLLFVFTCLLCDYYKENTDQKRPRRIMYLFVISGFVSSIANIFYYIFVCLPVGNKEALCYISGQNELLGLYMLASIWCAARLMYKNSKKTRNLLLISQLPVLAVLLFSRSILPYILGMVLLLGVLIKKKAPRLYLWFMVFSSVVMSVFTLFKYHSPIKKDALISGLSRITGLGGGGFLKAQEMYQTTFYPPSESIGLMETVISSSGIAGLLFVVFLIARCFYLFLKRKTQFSYMTLMLVIFIFVIPVKNAFSMIMLLCVPITYNEYYSLIKQKIMPKAKLAKIVSVLSVLSALCIYLAVHSFVTLRADGLFSKKEYAKALPLYKYALNINPSDDESCVKASQCIRKTQGDYTEAFSFIEKAEKRNKMSIQNTTEKAEIYNYAKLYEESASCLKYVCKIAPFNDNYKIKLAKVYYKILKEKEQGSEDAKNVYNEIIAISEKTANLDCKEKINDIADKAIKYTKGVLYVE